jgi:hypothetical protein
VHLSLLQLLMLLLLLLKLLLLLLELLELLELRLLVGQLPLEFALTLKRGQVLSLWQLGRSHRVEGQIQQRGCHGLCVVWRGVGEIKD